MLQPRQGGPLVRSPPGPARTTAGAVTAANVVEVNLARHETGCRKCARPIRSGQRAVLVLGTGQVHLRCLLGQPDESVQGGDGRQADDTTGE